MTIILYSGSDVKSENQTRKSNSSRCIATHVQFIIPVHSRWMLHE